MNTGLNSHFVRKIFQNTLANLRSPRIYKCSFWRQSNEATLSTIVFCQARLALGRPPSLTSLRARWARSFIPSRHQQSTKKATLLRFSNLQPHDVLFIDEIHRLPRVIEEVLYGAMEDYTLDIIIGQGPAAKTLKIDLPPFTLVGATTRTGLLTSPLRDRFGVSFRLDFYSHLDLQKILKRSARILKVEMEDAGASEIARRSRGTPRIANRLLRRVRDFAQVKAQGVITEAVAQEGLALLDVDTHGLDAMDRRILQVLVEKFDGGPAGIETLSAAIGEERDTLEDVYEPYLLQEGFLQRTPRGRMATRKAFDLLGVKPRLSDTPTLF